MPKLVILAGKNRGMKLSLPERELVVGREKGCDITLATTEVSRRHCVLKVGPESISARDLGSRNGTWINDVRLTAETELNQGDVLRIGPMIFRAEVKTLVARGAEAASYVPTEDSVANWLIEDEQKDSSGDSTIISAKPDTATINKPLTDEVSSVEVSSVTAAPRPAPKKYFATVAEEAADIIRRHQELKNAAH